MQFRFYTRLLAAIFFASMFISVPQADAADSANMKTLTAEELVRILNMKVKPPKALLFHVGSHMFYVQAHIPGSEYIGQGNTTEGLRRLRERTGSLPKNVSIVLYCGCCPWSHCPNVNPAYDALVQMGFSNVKVLFMANNFGADWVDKGYPVARGE